MMPVINRNSANTNDETWFSYDANQLKVVKSNGLILTHLILKNAKYYELNEILPKNAIHFLFPINNDVSISLESKNYKHLICKAKNTTLLLDCYFKNDKTRLNYKNNTDISVFSFSYDYFRCHEYERYTSLSESFFYVKMTKQTYLQNDFSHCRILNIINVLKSCDKIKQTDQKLINEMFSELQYIYLKTYLECYNEAVLNSVEIKKIESLPSVIAKFKNQSISNTDLALELKISVAQLHLGCELVFNCGLRNLINKVKIKHAITDLKKEGLTLANVVYKNGFLDRNYFYNAFKTIHGCLPMEFLAK